MRSDVIVPAQPCVDDGLRLAGGGKPLGVEQFGAQCAPGSSPGQAIEALVVSVLPSAAPASDCLQSLRGVNLDGF